VGLIIIATAILPLSWWLRRNPHEAPKIWILVGFLPFLLIPFHLFIAIISAQWPGFVSGAEFSLLDGLALALYLSLPGAPRPVPFRLSMGLYFLAVLLTTVQARVPIVSLFYPWQLARMFLVYATVARGVSADSRVATALLKGLAAGLIMEASIGAWQRFVLGIIQVPGTFSAQNELGLVSHFVVFPFFALLLSGPSGWLAPIVVLAGIAVDALTLSRATVGIAGFGFAIAFMLSAARQWTSKKMHILQIGLALIVILALFVPSMLAQREIVDSTTGSDLARESFVRAAEMILADHPFGIGSNQYLTVANMEGYDDRAGVSGNERVSIVHNSYLLAAVETGYPGLFLLVVCLLQPLTTALLCSWRHRGDQRGDLLLGLGVALLAVYTQAYFEWVFFNFQCQYLLVLNLGMVAGLAEQLGYWRRAYHALGRPRARSMSIRSTSNTNRLKI
jgi:hypothetical protein